MASEATLEQEPQVPKTLYHYTNQEGLIGIAQSQVMWATKIQFLNDRYELQHAVNQWKPVLVDLMSEADTKNQKRFLDHLVTLLDELNRFRIFVSSFSEKGDSLSQWRAYSPHGTGYALGFDTEALSHRMKEQDFRLVRCAYDPSDHERLLKLIAEVVLGRFREELDESHPPVNYDTLNATRAFVTHFALAAPMMKHETFEDEAEWRMVSNPFDEFAPRQLKVRSGRSFPIPYYEFRLTKSNEPMLLNELVIGPCPEPDLARQGAWDLFPPTGDVLCNNIRLSNIPFRNW